MEESEEILLSSLKNLGIEIPPQITSIKHLNSSSLFSISSQSLNLLSQSTNTASFPTSMPDSMAEKVKSCTDMASLFQHLGYPFEITFQKFLHPSEEDLYKLIRFLVERLSGLSEARRTVNFVDNVGSKSLESNTQLTSSTRPEKTTENLVYLNNHEVRARLQDVTSEVAPVSTSNSVEVRSYKNNLADEKLDDAATAGKVDKQEKEAYTEDLKKKAAQVGKSAVVSGTCKSEQEPISGESENSLPELRSKFEGLCSQESETRFTDKDAGKDSDLHHLEVEHELLKEAMNMALDDEHSFNFYVDQISEKIASRKRNLHELENQWEIDRKSLEDKKLSLLESLCVNKPDCELKLQKLKDIDKEMHSVLSEIRKREEECAKLAGDLEKQPKGASRRSYIERITEITKNSRKLDADIERILKETRELKLESNSIEERLHRTYAVVDETILREAKKDSVGRQAYRMLTNIHESFEKVREQILAADKAQREVAELEVKLSSIASRSLDKSKLQADLDAMRRENELLEKTLLNRECNCGY